MPWHSVRKEVRGEIMKTDILCEILFSAGSSKTAEDALHQTFDIFRDFEKRYSRFIVGNDLWKLNQSEEACVSEELFSLLAQAQQFYVLTEGLFDPSILPALEKEGYVGVYTIENGELLSEEHVSFSQVQLDHDTLTIRKPKHLKIDLGGIGKGFVVDKVAKFLKQKDYTNFLIDAGGDIYVRGANRKEQYPYWAIDVENPQNPDHSIALLCLSDQAVATSGRNRRHWTKSGQEKHHLIDPKSGHSAQKDFLSVTVIASSTAEADVLAKALFIAGEERGMIMADTLQIPAIFIRNDGSIHINNIAMPYVWKK